MSYDWNALDAVYGALPRAPIRGLRAKWLAPLVEQGFGEWIGELESAAYGHLEDCGWRDTVRQAPAMHKADGDVDRRWCDAMRAAAGKLASAGQYAGPEGNRERWVSWLVYTLSEPHRHVKEQLP